MKGHIKITDKVYFKPDKLPKPSKPKFPLDSTGDYLAYGSLMKAYEASKRTVEVSNKIRHVLTKLKKIKWLLLPHKAEKIEIWDIIKNNQPCEAEVTDKAIITKLL